jgi:hypothetical protein
LVFIQQSLRDFEIEFNLIETTDEERVSRVVDYMHDNRKEFISIIEAQKVMQMSHNSTCKQLKRSQRFDIIRIGSAWIWKLKDGEDEYI